MRPPLRSVENQHSPSTSEDALGDVRFDDQPSDQAISRVSPAGYSSMEDDHDYDLIEERRELRRSGRSRGATTSRGLPTCYHFYAVLR